MHPKDKGTHSLMLSRISRRFTTEVQIFGTSLLEVGEAPGPTPGWLASRGVFEVMDYSGHLQSIDLSLNGDLWVRGKDSKLLQACRQGAHEGDV